MKEAGYTGSVLGSISIIGDVKRGGKGRTVKTMAKNTGMERILRLTHNDHFPPFADSTGGESKGMVIEILDKALAMVNLKAMYIPETLDKVQDLVRNGQADGIAVFAMNSGRLEIYDYSESLIITGGGLFGKVPGPNPFDLEGYTGRTVCTPLKGPLADYIRKAFPRVNLTTVSDYPAALETVLEKKADAAALNMHVGANLVHERYRGRFNIPEKIFLEIPLGVAALKGKRTAMLQRINDGLKKIKEDGTYDKILMKWAWLNT